MADFSLPPLGFGATEVSGVGTDPRLRPAGAADPAPAGLPSQASQAIRRQFDVEGSPVEQTQPAAAAVDTDELAEANLVSHTIQRQFELQDQQVGEQALKLRTKHGEDLDRFRQGVQGLAQEDEARLRVNQGKQAQTNAQELDRGRELQVKHGADLDRFRQGRMELAHEDEARLRSNQGKQAQVNAQELDRGRELQAKHGADLDRFRQGRLELAAEDNARIRGMEREKAQANVEELDRGRELQHKHTADLDTRRKDSSELFEQGLAGKESDQKNARIDKALTTYASEVDHEHHSDLSTLWKRFEGRMTEKDVKAKEKKHLKVLDKIKAKQKAKKELEAEVQETKEYAKKKLERKNKEDAEFDGWWEGAKKDAGKDDEQVAKRILAVSQPHLKV